MWDGYKGDPPSAENRSCGESWALGMVLMMNCNGAGFKARCPPIGTPILEAVFAAVRGGGPGNR